MKKFEDLFIDSQRKHSAPVGSNNQRMSSNPFSIQPSTVVETDQNSKRDNKHSFNNTMH
jgi:hypothetical protein